MRICIICRLIEKVWVVSSVRKSRWKTKSYRIHMLLLAPYSGIAAIMVWRCANVVYQCIDIKQCLRLYFILQKLKKLVCVSLDLDL